MRSFYDLYPEIAEKETLTIQIENEAAPDGIYIFFENFCDNLACRCTTVILDVLFFDSNDHEKNKKITSINYAWEQPISQKNPAFHEKSVKSAMAQATLKLLRRALKETPAYAKSLDTHFAMVRAYVCAEQRELLHIKENAFKYGRNDPCPCGSNKKYKKCCE